MFGGYFRMHKECDECGLPFDCGAGYYLGSIYINYGITALLIIIGYFSMFLGTEISDKTRLVLLTAFCVLFPLWFFRYARSLWRGMDHYFDPPQSRESQRLSAAVRPQQQRFEQEEAEGAETGK